MNTYIFLYFNSKQAEEELTFSHYKIKSSRFYQAFRSFKNYLETLAIDYIGYGKSYYVNGPTQKSHRLLTDKQLIELAYVKDRHNARYYEVYNDEIY